MTWLRVRGGSGFGICCAAAAPQEASSRIPIRIVIVFIVILLQPQFQSLTTEGAIARCCALKRCLRIVAKPATSARAEHSNAFGNPTRVAKAPHIVLPIAIPPCRTSKYIDSARALTHDGHIVWAAVLRQARIPIHAAPAVAITAHSQPNDEMRPAEKVIAANTTIAVATNPSTESCLRKRGKIVAPASAPMPKHPSRAPYPVAPNGRATIGSSASNAIAPTLKAPVRIRTDRTSEDWRT